VLLGLDKYVRRQDCAVRDSGSMREPDRNEQAIGVYVVFPRWPAPIT